MSSDATERPAGAVRRSLSRRLLLATYPPWFRERYGDELAALLDDAGVGVRDALDLLLGAVRAWLRPSYGAAPVEARRLRLLSSVSTVWVGFCVVLCGSLGTLRLLEDPPVPGLALGTPRWVAFHQLATAALLLSCLLVVAGGVPVGLRALRSGPVARRTALGPVVGLAVLVITGPAVYAGLVLMPGTPLPPAAYPVWFVVAALTWLLLVPVVATWWAVALPRALRISAPRARDLVASALLSVLVVGLLAPSVALVVAVSYRSVRFWGTGLDSTVIVLCVAGVVVGWLVSAVSAMRAVPALRPRQ